MTMDADVTKSSKRRNPRHKYAAWTHSAGEYGHTVRVYRDRTSGYIYGEMRDPARPGHYRCVSLRHRDTERAIQWAEEQSAKWARRDSAGGYVEPTVANVFALYREHQTPRKVEAEQDADERRIAMWARVLGTDKDVSTVSLREWQWFTESRRSGAIDSEGKAANHDRQKPVRTGTVAADLVFLRSVLNWAAKWRLETGRYLLNENPVRGYPIPNEKNPRRPVVTDDRFQKVRAVSDRVTMVVGAKENRRETRSYLSEILDIANGTGRRISAILALRYQDLILAEGGPFGSIRWPATTDKMKKEWVVPMSKAVRSAMNRILAQRPGIGAAPLFPSGEDPSKPVRIEVASAWLLRAERLAGVPKQEGTLWHAYRRRWATLRKHLPATDVAAAGGWSDLSTLTQVYQQADVETMYRVVSEPARLIELSQA